MQNRQGVGLQFLAAGIGTIVVWAYLGMLTPMNHVSFGILDIAVVMCAILIPMAIVNQMATRRVFKTLVSPLHEISTVTRSITEGATSGRIFLAESAAPEVREVASAINELAKKATKDIEELRRLEQVRSEFVANVSHELRTPIFSVQGYLETLLDGAIDDPEVALPFLEKAYANALRLNTLLNDLIDISRIESGELKFSFRFVNVMQVLTDILPTVALRSEQRNVTVTVVPDLTENISVYADRDRITQVLTNLIDNAIKYNVVGGTVEVLVAKHEELVAISVRDSGIGIARENQSRIFERFYRVDKDRSREVGGTGLGLAIVKHIVEAHQSKLDVQSEVGVGTTISFQLKGA
ncbi:MAG: two-component sensor histidine kinase [Ignavibacteria bacterium]|nr:two-component sensor histidine kinase [Ignavibacteria bacterium]